MKGRRILIEPLQQGGYAAALVIDGTLDDILLDVSATDPAPRPEAIHRAIAGRPMKGTGGMIVDLGGGQSGFLRSKQLPSPGQSLLVQVSGWAERGKATPVSDRVLLKGRHVILTPGAPGLNIARGIRDEDRRETLGAIAAAAMGGAAPDLGLIVRSAAEHADQDEITAEILRLRSEWDGITKETRGPAQRLRSAPSAAEEARREWVLPGDSVLEGPTAFAVDDIWTVLEELSAAPVQLSTGTMTIEMTRALTAVDVNTGGDLNAAAALRANLAAVQELPRQLRLRGIGGQIVVDFAPLARSDRARIETALGSALRRDPIDTTVAGWTPLGHLELLRKRARKPLSENRPAPKLP